MRSFSITLILLALAGTAGARDSARSLFQAAERAEAAGDTLNAYFLYSRAAAELPQAALASKMLGTRLLQTAVTAAGPDPATGPERMANRIVLEQLSPTDAIESDRALAPPRLAPSTERKPFELRATARLLIEQVTQAFGIQAVFEPDFPTSTPAIGLKTGELTRDEALRTLEAATNTFMVPVGEHTVLVFPDTSAKRADNVSAMAVAVPIPERMNVQEAQELASGVQQIIELRHIAVDAGRRVIFLRDQEYKVLAARRMITELARFRSQVSIEVELLSVSNTSTLGIGLNLQTAAQIVNLNGPSILANLARMGTSWFGLGLTNAQAFATLSRGSSQASVRTQIVSLDGQQAQLTVGDRFPIITGLSGFGDTSVPVVQLQDLGLKRHVTPVVHGDGDVTLTIEADYTVLGGGSNNGIPIISNRKYQGTVRAKGDQWVVIAGLAAAQHSSTSNGIAGLGNLPGVGRLFRKDTVIDDNSQILIVLKPRVTSQGAWANPTNGFWIGTDTKPPTYY